MVNQIQSKHPYLKVNCGSVQAIAYKRSMSSYPRLALKSYPRLALKSNPRLALKSYPRLALKSYPRLALKTILVWL